METRARYALIGLFIFAVILASFAFVYWLENKGGFGERATYRIQFQSPVSGLLVGSAVLFNGVRVGEVTRIALNPDAPQQVIATIGVVEHTPIREDTQVSIEQQGLTGGVAVTLTGGISTTPLAANGGAPTLVAPPGIGRDWTQSARDAFQEVQQLLQDNAEPLNEAIENIEVFTDALARNSDRVDGILAGIERMTGGSGAGGTPLFSLTAVSDIPVLDETPDWQLVISEPATLLGFNTDKLLIQPAPDETLPLDDARWTDSLPILVQAKILQTFENAGYTESVSRMQEGVAPTYRLNLDIRRFHIATEGSPEAEIVVLARLLDPDGETIATKMFKASAPASGSDPRHYVDAFGKAFDTFQVELLDWTTAELDTAPVAPVTVEPPSDPGALPPPGDIPPPPDQPTP